MQQIHGQPILISPNTLKPDKPLFIFLPSMEGSGQLLRTQAAGLEAAFDVRCLVLPPDDLTDWPALTEKVVELIKAEIKNGKAEKPLYLGGESFGACLALKVASSAPHLFSHILLINSASSFGERPWMLWGGQIIHWFPSSLYKLSALALIPFLASLDQITPTDFQALLNSIYAVPKETSLWRLSLLKRFSLTDLPLQTLTQPILVIASAADRLLPSVTEAQKLADHLPNAQLYILPQSGHACLLEEKVNLYQIMKSQNFLPVITKPCNLDQS
jgi:pimeloyl-ACP methyl ester carboxylesterase